MGVQPILRAAGQYAPQSSSDITETFLTKSPLSGYLSLDSPEYFQRDRDK